MNKLLLVLTLISGSAFGQVPVFSPLAPPPSNLAVSPTALPSTGGNAALTFDSYFANSCTAKSGVSAGCPALPAPWNGGTLCVGSTNAAGQTSCVYNSSVAVPANPNAAACVYSFQAACTGNSTAASQVVSVAVAGKGSPPPTTTCTATPNPEVPSFTRQCSGSAKNKLKGNVIYNSTFASLFGAEFPGPTIQSGWPLTMTVGQYNFAAFQFNTGSTPSGLHMESNTSYGFQALLSVSTVPGQIDTAICKGSTLNISSKSPTLAFCKLQLNTTYYLNVSMADYFPPHNTDCETASCLVAWTPYLYSN